MSEIEAGTLSALVGTEHTVRTLDDSGSYVFVVDLSAMESDDVVELRFKDKILSAGALLGYLIDTYTGVQSADDVEKVSIPVPVLYQGRATIKRTAGAGTLSLPWSVRRIGSVVLAAEGTQLAVIGTEHVAAIVTAPGDYVFGVDVSAMLSGDTLGLRFKDKILSAGSLMGSLYDTWSDAPSVDDVLKMSTPTRVEHQGQGTIKQTVGTGRSYPFSLRKVDS